MCVCDFTLMHLTLRCGVQEVGTFSALLVIVADIRRIVGFEISQHATVFCCCFFNQLCLLKKCQMVHKLRTVHSAVPRYNNANAQCSRERIRLLVMHNYELKLQANYSPGYGYGNEISARQPYSAFFFFFLIRRERVWGHCIPFFWQTLKWK